jgi:signal peptidase I
MEKATHKKRKRKLDNKRNRKKQTDNPKRPVKKLSAKKKEALRKHRQQKRRKKRLRKIRRLCGEIGLTILATGVLVYLLSLFTFSFAKVEGYSMSSTLVDGEVVLINKLAAVQRFDLVYMRIPGTKETTVRRMIGKPGENVYYKNSQLFINEEEKEEHFITEYQRPFEKEGMLFTEDFTIKGLTGHPTIPKGKYLVLGDNRPYATDSRYYGLVDEKEIIGVVEMRILPFHKVRWFS